jgi:predicted RNase H-like HicB family nuclease
MKVAVLIHKSEDGSGYWAQAPALPGCVTYGASREELVANIREAVEGSLLVESGVFRPEEGGVREELELCSTPG